MSALLASLLPSVIRRFSNSQAEDHRVDADRLHHEQSHVSGGGWLASGAVTLPWTSQRASSASIDPETTARHAQGLINSHASTPQDLVPSLSIPPSSQHPDQAGGPHLSRSMSQPTSEFLSGTQPSNAYQSPSGIGSIHSTRLPMSSSPRSNVMARRVLVEGPRSRIRRTSENESIARESLPADDGMSLMRKQIHQIREMAASSEEKARRLHSLMTERYLANNPQLARAQSPASMLSGERPFTPNSPTGFGSSETLPHSPSSTIEDIDPRNPFNIVDTDLTPSYRPPRSRRPSIDYEDYSHDVDPNESSNPELGCRHYKRNVKIQCYDCKRWYTCRHCHDEKEEHSLQRRKTENMLCMLCKTPQSAGPTCKNCEHITAYYFCDICKLWDDDTGKRIYHCVDCGICRRGEGVGKDFVHCKKCNICIAIASANSHRCIERAAECDCPICGDYMFTSSSSIVAMPCGHYLHKACYTQYMTMAYKCPICKRSAVNMELQWRKLEHAIESQPMPEELRDTRVTVQCNDCNHKTNVRYHWLGNKCGDCDSFNTNELQLIDSIPQESTLDQQREIDNISQMREQTRPRFPWTRSRTHSTVNSDLPMTESNTVRAASGSYFLSVQDSTVDNDPERRGSIGGLESIAQNIPFSPLEMFQRVGRSLSPLGNYLNALDSEGEDSEEDVDFWGIDGHFLSGEEEDADEEEEGDQDSEDFGSENDDMHGDEDLGNDNNTNGVCNNEEESDEDLRSGNIRRIERRGLDDLDELTGHR